MKRYNILVISYDTIPGASGGWVSNVDLLERTANLVYLCGRTDKFFEVEGIKVYDFDYEPMGRIETLKTKLAELWYDLDFDFALCLGDRESQACMELNIPYVTKYHTLPLNMRRAEHVVKKDAILVIENHNILPKTIVDLVIPHSINPLRFNKCMHERLNMDNLLPAKAVLVASLNHIEDPLQFISAAQSASIPSAVYGDGVMRDTVIMVCEKRSEIVQYRGAIDRAKLPDALKEFQYGVACLSKSSQNVHQLKIIEYMAGGLIPIQPIHSVPHKNCYIWTYDTPYELLMLLRKAKTLDYDTRGLREKLQMNREYVEKHFNALLWEKKLWEVLVPKLEKRGI